MYPKPTGALVCSLVLWRKAEGGIFLLFPRKYFQLWAGIPRGLDAVLRMPSQQCS